nr:EOG090X0MNX [Cyclestheria hislopi]
MSSSVFGRLVSLTGIFKNPIGFYNQVNCNVFNNSQQVRYKWADWRMIKDVRKRKCLVEHAPERLRINSLRKNDILPPEIREFADKEIAALPRDSSIVRIRNRCALTSRPRGVVHRWRLSRIVWRHLADYNKLSAVQRAMW